MSNTTSPKETTAAVSRHVPLSSTPRTTLHRHKERGSIDRADLYAVLDAGLICHLGVVADGAPLVLPTAYARDGDTMYLHGSSANGAFGASEGQQICATVTHMDGIVCARSVFSHSVNYRSAVVVGVASLVHDEDERWQALRLITDHLVPGRWADSATAHPQGDGGDGRAVPAAGRGVGKDPHRNAQRPAGGPRPGRVGGCAADVGGLRGAADRSAGAS